jgi:hypothetical protein
MSTKIPEDCNKRHPETKIAKTKKEKKSKEEKRAVRGIYLYEITLVALVTRGNKTVNFAFDFVLFVVLHLEMLTKGRIYFWVEMGLCKRTS